MIKIINHKLFFKTKTTNYFKKKHHFSSFQPFQKHLVCQSLPTSKLISRKKPTHKDWLNRKHTILEEKAWVDIKLYSHIIINCTLCIIDDEFGKAIANDVIVSMGLEELGWNVSE
jgi:hypothetical protein